MLRPVLITFIILFMSLLSRAQEVWMIPNGGQWDERIEYKVDLQMGEMLVEKDGFTFFLNDAAQTMRHTHDEGEADHETPDSFRAQVIRSKFQGSSWKGKVEKLDSSTHYSNYILGNDQSKWASFLYSYSRISMLDYYQGID